jgi:hypothetical protein
MTDFRGLLGALVGNRVEFVVVGGVAATIHGGSRLTQDVDVVYRRTPENVERLVRALAPTRPYLRGAPPGLPFVFDASTIEAGLNFTLTTVLGDIDLLGEVTGGGRFEDLQGRTVEVSAYGHAFRCVDLPTLIRLKRAAGRPKDLEAIGELERLLDLPSE